MLYLRGLSTGDFRDALSALLGEEAIAGFSATTVTRLLAVWQDEYRAWRNRLLGDTPYLYIWADGVYFNIRLGEDRLAALVIIGVRPDGVKEVIALADGYRESTESWATLLRDLQRRGLPAPKLAVADGALGFWAALREVYPTTEEQRCWVHKTANVLDKLPAGCSDGPSPCCTKSCMHRTKPRPWLTWNVSARSIRTSTRRRSSVCSRTRRLCSPSWTIRPPTGFICGRPMSLSLPSRR